MVHSKNYIMEKLTKWVTLLTWAAFCLLLTAKLTFSPGLKWLYVFIPLLAGLSLVIGAFVVIGIYFYFNRDKVKNIFNKTK